MDVKKDKLPALNAAVTAGLTALRDRPGLDAKLRDHLLDAYETTCKEFGVDPDPAKADFSHLSDADLGRLSAALGRL